MERTYGRTYQRTGMRRRAHSRSRYWQHDQTEEPMKFTKKLAIQSVVCAVLFALVWGVSSLNNEISSWMESEITYAINHQIDFQTVYRSAVDMTKYFASLLVKKDGQPPAQPASTQTGEAEPTSVPTAFPSASSELD